MWAELVEAHNTAFRWMHAPFDGSTELAEVRLRARLGGISHHEGLPPRFEKDTSQEVRATTMGV